MSWDEVSYVVRSKVRRSVLARLQTPKTPTLLAKELSTSLPNISRALSELESKGLIEVLTPDARVGKIYAATEKGKAVSSKVRNMSEVPRPDVRSE
ncbi:MAG: helix-turn-helix domain-containing protein [Nitrososphaerales archaeon]|jgi:DNA-binding PadR family transcriptional regulator